MIATLLLSLRALTVAGMAAVTPVASAPLAADSLLGPGASVPYLGQTPLLCGGAAAAMVERFWGARGVYAEDFQHLVRADEGGIRATELRSALEARGWTASVSVDRPTDVLSRLAAGYPPIVLLDGDGASPLHYVVVTAADADRVQFHDPNYGPSRILAYSDFMASWRASGYWALTLEPSPDVPTRAVREVRGARATDATSPRRGVHSQGTADALVPVPPLLDSALTALRGGEYAEARRLARLVDAADAEGAATAQRLVVTAYYREGDAERALREWNALGEPSIDLVTIQGASKTRHHVLAARLGLQAPSTLTPEALALGRRRLQAAPSVLVSRVDYVPVDTRSVQVEAAVVERGRLPGTPGLVAEGVRAVTHAELRLQAGPFLPPGERWTVTGGWDHAYPHASVSVATPADPIPGIAQVGLEWRRERYADAAAEERVRGTVGVSDWLSPSLHVGLELGFEEWDGGSHRGSLGISSRWSGFGDDLTVTGDLAGWVGGTDPYARVGVGARARVPRGPHREWRMTAGAAFATRGAPRMVWPGAGTGRARAPLLRAHPLVGDGVIDGDAFAPGLIHATLEHRIGLGWGPIRAGGTVFVDSAVPCGPSFRGCSRPLLDAGIGVFVDEGDRGMSVSLARGGPGWVLSTSFGISR